MDYEKEQKRLQYLLETVDTDTELLPDDDEDGSESDITEQRMEDSDTEQEGDSDNEENEDQENTRAAHFVGKNKKLFGINIHTLSE